MFTLQLSPPDDEGLAEIDLAESEESNSDNEQHAEKSSSAPGSAQKRKFTFKNSIPFVPGEVRLDGGGGWGGGRGG